MCQCRFLVGEIRIILESGVGNGGGFAYVGAGVTGHLYTSLSILL